MKNNALHRHALGTRVRVTLECVHAAQSFDAEVIEYAAPEKEHPAYVVRQDDGRTLRVFERELSTPAHEGSDAR